MKLQAHARRGNQFVALFTVKMPSSKVAKSLLSFDIKSASIPLESVIIRSSDLNTIEQDLQSRFAAHPDFFNNDPVVIDLSQLSDLENAQALDLAALYLTLKSYKMKPVALRSSINAHQAWAELTGLFCVPSAMPIKNSNESTQQQAVSATNNPVPVQDFSDLPAVQATESNPLNNPQLPSISCALIIDKPLRSGQHVYAKGRDLVVMEMVNPGAEIMADGHIHVYAPLRGKAIAGARGNKDARIYTSCLQAELLSIAGIYRTSDTPIPATVAGKSAQIRLIDDKLIMKPQ
jgi:septum site-determining protein MinC